MHHGLGAFYEVSNAHWVYELSVYSWRPSVPCVWRAQCGLSDMESGLGGLQTTNGDIRRALNCTVNKPTNKHKKSIKKQRLRSTKGVTIRGL